VLVTQIKVIDDRAEVPKKAHESDSGFDLKFIDIKKIQGDVIFFRTGIQISPPIGYYFDIVPRSSISNLPLEMANSVGIIDEHYRGEILVPIRITHPEMGHDQTNNNFANGVVKIFGVKPQTMMDVAKQIIINKPYLCQMILRKKHECEFKLVDALDETARDSGGFGSTDVKKKAPTKKPKVVQESTNKENIEDDIENLISKL
jgi:dUTP pyrophosphatase